MRSAASLVSELSMQEQHYDDVPAHIAGCLETLERRGANGPWASLIQESRNANDGR